MKELLAVEFASFTAEVCRLCIRLNIFFSIENAHSSALCRFGPIAALGAHSSVSNVVFDCCQFGQPYKKRTRLLTNHPGTAELGGFISYEIAAVSSNFRQWVPRKPKERATNLMQSRLEKVELAAVDKRVVRDGAGGGGGGGHPKAKAKGKVGGSGGPASSAGAQ